MTAFPLRRAIVGLLLAAVIVAAAPPGAAAQAIDRAEAITVALWPEFDRPETLVILRVTLPADVPLPTTVRIPIPPDAPPLTAVAYRDPADGLVNATYQRQEGTAADIVMIETAARELQLEYYEPLTTDGDSRSLAFTWPGGMPTGSFVFEVQQPAGAEAFEITPPATSAAPDSLGITYHRIDLGAQAGDEQPSVEASYRNPTGELTAASMPPEVPLAPPSASAGGAPSLSSILPWLLLGAGIVLIGGGVIYYFRVVRAPEPSSRARHRRAREGRAERTEVDASPVFCHNCGTQASATDRFCRMCGTALRT